MFDFVFGLVGVWRLVWLLVWFGLTCLFFFCLVCLVWLRFVFGFVWFSVWFGLVPMGVIGWFRVSQWVC